jgi:glycosyltransferase involved in cell wall biosynthesis
LHFEFRESAISSSPVPGRLSVITPVFNGEDFLEETLRSLVASDYEDIEFILVDDGSTDKSLSISKSVLESSGRNCKIISKSNSGEADSDNVGLAASSGEFIAIVNADDPVYPSLFTKSIHALNSDQNLVVTYPDWDMIDKAGKLLKTVITADYSLDSLLGDNSCLPGPGAVIRRSSIKSPILRKPEFRYTSDFRQWLTLSSVGDFKRIPETLCTWRVHDGQQTVAALGSTQAEEMLRCISDFYKDGPVSPAALKLKSQAESQSYYLAAIQSLYRDNVPGRRYLLKSLVLFYRRNSGYTPNRRSFVVMVLISLNPLGRLLVKRSKTR